jgi:hypothetical protein
MLGSLTLLKTLNSMLIAAEDISSLRAKMCVQEIGMLSKCFHSNHSASANRQS